MNHQTVTVALNTLNSGKILNIFVDLQESFADMAKMTL